MDPQYIPGPNGEMLRVKYENNPETWTEKEIFIAILSELKEIKRNQKVLEGEISVIKLLLKK